MKFILVSGLRVSFCLRALQGARLRRPGRGSWAEGSWKLGLPARPQASEWCRFVATPPQTEKLIIVAKYAGIADHAKPDESLCSGLQLYIAHIYYCDFC